MSEYLLQKIQGYPTDLDIIDPEFWDEVLTEFTPAMIDKAIVASLQDADYDFVYNAGYFVRDLTEKAPNVGCKKEFRHFFQSSQSIARFLELCEAPNMQARLAALIAISSAAPAKYGAVLTRILSKRRDTDPLLIDDFADAILCLTKERKPLLKLCREMTMSPTALTRWAALALVWERSELEQVRQSVTLRLTRDTYLPLRKEARYLAAKLEQGSEPAATDKDAPEFRFMVVCEKVYDHINDSGAPDYYPEDAEQFCDEYMAGTLE